MIAELLYSSLTIPLPVLAFGFANLVMLGWLAAASIPVIIHLWNKRKHREVSWAAIDFLVAALRRNARRIQLQQWLLLAVRMLLIVLVVIAMSEPYLEQMGLNFVPGQRTHKVLVIDGSYSMGYRPTDSSRFTRAKQLAAQIVDESPQGDGFSLVLMGSPPRTIVGAPVFEPNRFIEEIDSLELPHAGGDLPASLVQVQEILERARVESPGLERAEVYFLTDLGRNSWAPDLSGGEAAAEFRARVDRLADEAALVVLDLGQTESENLAVTDFKLLDAYATTGGETTFQAQARNFGTQPRSRHLAELLVDGVRVQEAFADIEPGGEATLNFSYRFESPRPHAVQVRLGADLLDIDNNRYLSVPVKSNLRVLLVSGKQGAASYIADALDPDRSPASLIQPQIVAESGLIEMDLAAYDAVFLCNVAQWTSKEAKLLESYLKRGGGLVFFLGDRVLPQRYNQELASEAEEAVRVLPARLGPLVDEAQYRFDPLDYQHPIVAPFRGREQAGLLTTPVYRYYRLVVPEAWTQSSVALAFAGGDPAIVEAPLHRGRSILVATAGSLASVDPVSKTPWTTMPAWPSFVPIVQELLAHAVGSQTAQFNSIVGDAVGSSLPIAAVDAPIRLETPGGEQHTARAESQIDHAQWSFAPTDESGVYTAKLGAPLSTTELFAVNVNTAESDLTKADADELPPDFTVQTEWQNLDQQSTAQISRRSGLHEWLLYAVLALLLAEVYLAWRFGRGTT